jgi:hypothetical protein
MRRAGHVACTEEKMAIKADSGGKAKARESLGRRRRSWEDDIKMGLREIG